VSPSNIAALAAVLNPIFRVRVVVVYRRFYEWLPSWHNMFYKVSSSGKTFRGQEITWTFPNNGQGSGLPFDLDNRIGTSDFVYDMELLQQHPAQMVRDKFAEFFSDVNLMKLHNLPSVVVPSDDTTTATIDPTLHNFICSVLSHATHSCRAVEQGTIRGASFNNPSTSFDYDLLAMAAHEKGNLLDRSLSRKDVGVQIQQYNSLLLQQHQQRAAEDNDGNSNNNIKTLESFPRECLSEPKLDRLLQLSLMGERNLFYPGQTSRATMNQQQQKQEEEEQQHRREFAAFQSKLCWLDTTAVLQDASWQLFLQSLGTSPLSSSLLPANNGNNGARL
jgi:hypothetical protein